jgi:peptide/nickel transport system substrate-binding protein
VTEMQGGTPRGCIFFLKLSAKTRARLSAAWAIVFVLAAAPACQSRARAGRGSGGSDGEAAVTVAPGGAGDAAAVDRAQAPAVPGGNANDPPRPARLPACPAVLPPKPYAPSPDAIVRVHLPADPPVLDPLDESSELASLVLFGLVHEPLLSCGGRDDTGRLPEPAPGLAAKWQVSPAGDQITLHLRHGAVFHDGRAVSPVDVRATLEEVWKARPRMPLARAALADLAEIELPGGDTVRLRLKRPAPIVLRALCDIPIIPALGLGARRTPGREPLGSGPYRFAGWTRGRSLRLVRAARPGLPPAPAAEIVFVIEPDTGRALGRLRRGEIDLLPGLDKVHFPDQVRPAALGPNVALWTLASERVTFLAFDHRREPMSLVGFRRAVSLLWDRAGNAEELHRGLAQPIAAPFGDLPAPAFDATEAGRLLREAGIAPAAAPAVLKPRARSVPIRHRLTLVHAGGKIAAAEVRRVAERLRRLGVLLELKAVTPSDLSDRLRTGTFDLALLSWRGRPHEDPRLRFSEKAGYNFGGFASRRLETLLDELRASDGPQSRHELEHRIAVVLNEELPAVFLYRHVDLALANRRLVGLCNDGGRIDFSQAGLLP